jgi:hypothetical protein
VSRASLTSHTEVPMCSASGLALRRTAAAGRQLPAESSAGVRMHDSSAGSPASCQQRLQQVEVDGLVVKVQNEQVGLGLRRTERCSGPAQMQGRLDACCSATL